MADTLDPPVAALRRVVATALEEDLGILGDVTSIAVVPVDAIGRGRFVARRPGVLAGTAAATEVYRQLDPAVQLDWLAHDGDELSPGAVFGALGGPLRSVLTGERVALNLLQHCSGIATLTRCYVRATGGRTRIRDTRKTLPGLRALERAAVRAGGGFNHRDSLSDALLVKDNHLACLPLHLAVERARARWPGRVIEVECDNLQQVDAAAAAGVDLVLLDNMTPDQVREAKTRLGGAVPVEVSGGVTLDAVAAHADAGADFVSVGAITHSAPALDLALDLEVDTGLFTGPDPGLFTGPDPEPA